MKIAQTKAWAIFMVNHRTSQVETLFETLEEIDLKIKILGVVKIGSKMIYIADEK